MLLFLWDVKRNIKKKKTINFVAVVQTEVDNEDELKVMFMKNFFSDKSVYVMDEKDVSYVWCDQILGVSKPFSCSKEGKYLYIFKNSVQLLSFFSCKNCFKMTTIIFISKIVIVFVCNLPRVICISFFCRITVLIYVIQYFIFFYYIPRLIADGSDRSLIPLWIASADDYS